MGGRGPGGGSRWGGGGRKAEVAWPLTHQPLPAASCLSQAHTPGQGLISWRAASPVLRALVGTRGADMTSSAGGGALARTIVPGVDRIKQGSSRGGQGAWASNFLLTLKPQRENSHSGSQDGAAGVCKGPGLNYGA